MTLHTFLFYLHRLLGILLCIGLVVGAIYGFYLGNWAEALLMLVIADLYSFYLIWLLWSPAV